jgi:hypothetical protein
MQRIKMNFIYFYCRICINGSIYTVKNCMRRGRQSLNKMVLSFVFIHLYLPTHENKVTALAEQIMK